MNFNKGLSLRAIAPIDRDATRTHDKASFCATRQFMTLLTSALGALTSPWIPCAD
jgi:hypothetical protein